MTLQSLLGYKKGSPYENNPYNIINSNHITMSGVNKPLMLVPIINGTPDYSKQRLAKPGDPDIIFENDVEAVLEIPHNQIGGFVGSQVYQTLQQPQQFLTPEQQALIAKQQFQNPFPNQISQNPPVNVTVSEENPYLKTVSAGLSYSDIPNKYPDIPKTSVKIPTNPVSYMEKDNSITPLKRDTENNESIPRTMSNPYMGWDMATASTALGAFTAFDPNQYSKDGWKGIGQTGKSLGILGSAGKLFLEGYRNFESGRGAMTRFQQGLDEKRRLERESELKARQSWGGAGKGADVRMQKGGLLLDKLATGNFLKGQDDHPNPNTEVEKGEYVQTPDGKVKEVLGNRHSEGGELMNLPEETKVISDYLKIGSKLSRYFKKEYGLNVTAGSKFATVIDQYKRKIGLEKVLEEEEKILKKIRNQEDVDSESTRNANLDMLNDKIDALSPKKKELEKQLQIFTNVVFEKQEQTKQPGEMNFKKQEGGDVNQEQQYLQNLILQYAQIKGLDPNQIYQSLSKMGDQQSFQRAIEQMQQAIGETSQYQEGGQVPQEGNGNQLQHLIQAYAQATGQDPNQIVAMLQQAQSQEEFEQMVQQIIQELQQAQEPSVDPQQQINQDSQQQPQLRRGGHPVIFKPYC